MFSVLLYISTLLFFLYVFLHLTWRLWKRKYSFMPSAPNMPWLGTAPYLGGSEGFYKTMNMFAKRFDHLYILWYGPLPTIRAGRVEYIEAILRGQEPLTKTRLFFPLIDWLSDGLILSTGKKWKKRRTALTAAFHFSILREFSEIFETHAQHFVKKMESFVNKNEAIDVQSFLSLSTLDVICETAMGVKINALDASDSDYVRAVQNVKDLMIKRSLNPLLVFNGIYRRTSHGKMFYKQLNVLHNFTIGIINERIHSRNDASVSSMRHGRKKALLDTLLDLYDKGEIDLGGIREEVDTFMFAGHDSLSSGLSWTLYEIGRRPEIQQKVHHEIDNVALKDLSIMEKVGELKYLERVIKECLRFHPPVPMFGRTLEKDFVICGNTIPAGTEIIVESFSVHMNKLYWDEPNVFKPQRFQSEEFSKRNPYCYVPFSAGPRNCIGQKFSLLEMKIFLYYILSEYKIKSIQALDEMDIHYDGITHSVNGINIEFYSR